jgi:Tol biopolymer transport system component
MNSDGSAQRRVTTDAADDACPVWSPNGRQIAFSSNRTGNPQIYTMNADGSHQAAVVQDTGTSDYGPQWSPDGRTLAFTCGTEAASQVCIATVRNRRWKQLTPNSSRNFAPLWSPDGKKILFSSGRGLRNPTEASELWAINSDGTDPVRLTSVNHN